MQGAPQRRQDAPLLERGGKCAHPAGPDRATAVLYLGEINDAQRAAWCKSIEVLEAGSRSATQMAIFPEDRPAPELDCAVVQVRLDQLRLERPRQWGACWLALELWNWLQLDAFWAPRLVASRKGTQWLAVLKTLVAYRLIDPGSEWRLHRQWYADSAMGDLLGEDLSIAQPDTAPSHRSSSCPQGYISLGRQLLWVRRKGTVADGGGHGLLRAPRGAHELPGSQCIPASRHRPRATHVAAAKPDGRYYVAAGQEDRWRGFHHPGSFINGLTGGSPSKTRGGSRMPESSMFGSVRGGRPAMDVPSTVGGGLKFWHRRRGRETRIPPSDHGVDRKSSGSCRRRTTRSSLFGNTCPHFPPVFRWLTRWHRNRFDDRSFTDRRDFCHEIAATSAHFFSLSALHPVRRRGRRLVLQALTVRRGRFSGRI